MTTNRATSRIFASSLPAFGASSPPHPDTAPESRTATNGTAAQRTRTDNPPPGALVRSGPGLLPGLRQLKDFVVRDALAQTLRDAVGSGTVTDALLRHALADADLEEAAQGGHALRVRHPAAGPDVPLELPQHLLVFPE